MKKITFILGLFLVLIVTGCSDVDGVETGSINKISNKEYFQFLNVVDSITIKYQHSITDQQRNKNILTYAVNSKFEKLADAGGSVVGGWVGKHLGTMAGASLGNPVTVAVGYAGGRWLGRKIGGVLASYAYDAVKGYAAWKLASYFYKAPACQVKSDSLQYYIPSRDIVSSSDSLGYIHNMIMDSLCMQNEKYYSESGIDYILIYNDCLGYLKNYGNYDETVVNDTTFRNTVINYAKDIAELAISADNNEITYETFCDKTIEKQQEYGLSKEVTSIFRDYTVKISETCDKLSVEQQRKYADELYYAIDNSELSEMQKEEISSSTNMVINSSLFWTQKKSEESK